MVDLAKAHVKALQRLLERLRKANLKKLEGIWRSTFFTTTTLLVEITNVTADFVNAKGNA